MLLSSKNRLKFIVAIIFVNLSMLWLIYLSISLSIEKNNNFDGIIGVFIGGSLLILLDILFIYIRKYIFLEVKIENEIVKLYYFNKEISSCSKEDIKLVLFNKDTVFLLTDLPLEIDKKNIQKCINKNTITFRISCDKLKYLLSFVNTSEVFIIAKYSSYYSSEIERYSNVVYL